MEKVLVIVGPTAVGKSDCGISLAQRFHGEIISGDSIQVYRGLDIGSGKVTLDEIQDVPHYLIDILDNKENYSVADFQRNARKYIDQISGENKLPIIVGGTGLYIKSCLYDYTFNEQTNEETNSEWLEMTNEALYELLKSIDPKACETIHVNNRKRILRALTIANSGVTKSEIESHQQHKPIYDVMIIGLTCERELLYSRINKRVDLMFEAGLEKEIRLLLDNGVSFEDQAMQGIGYREWADYFQGNSSIDEVKESIKTHSRQFAKRQYTWFNNQMDVTWFDIMNENWLEECVQKVESWWNHE